MAQDITWVAMDTAKKKHAVAVLAPGKEIQEFAVPNEAKAIRRLARKLVREAPGEVRVCYEAGPCGFVLQRQLEAAAGLVCEVVAPSLIPVQPGQRIKTDRRDARRLLKLYRGEQLTVVHPPTAEEEAVRDLVRCREDAKQDLMRARHRLSKVLLRRGHVSRLGSAWTQRHARWMSEIVWEYEEDQEVFDSYCLAISHRQDQIRALDESIEAISQRDPYAKPVGWLRCFRGIDVVTAMTIVTELHGFCRFERAPELMGFLGMVPSEDSSGDRVRRGGLTKAGNCHVRRVLIESAWCNRHKPAVGYHLRKRRAGQPAWAIAHADRAMVRLSKKYRGMTVRGKHHNKVVAAVARELVGFIWAVMREGLLRERKQELEQELKRCRTVSAVSA
jgi:transposase